MHEASQEAHGLGSGTASSEYEAAKRAAGLPSDSKPNVFQMGRGKGLGGLLSAPIYAARFKLDTLSNELLDPLSDLLGKKGYLLEDEQPSSLDCLAFGYLALMLYAPVPQAWLKETIQTKHPRIARYIQRLREELLGAEETKAAEVWSASSGCASDAKWLLPWRRKPSPKVSPQLARDVVSNIPLLSYIPGFQRNTIQADSLEVARKSSTSLPSAVFVNILCASWAAITAGLAGLAVHHWRSPREGDLVFSAIRSGAGVRVDGFGEAESFLSVFAGQLPGGASAQL